MGGFRIIARKSDGRVRLYSRPGNDFTRRFPLIVEALARLRRSPAGGPFTCARQSHFGKTTLIVFYLIDATLRDILGR
jgi:hypothetical protein